MIVFTYPGQGSQSPGMGEAWIDHPSWELVTEASDITGRDVGHLLLKADADELTLTHNAQLATFVTSMMVLDAVSRVGAEAAGHAGHSLGEYSALCASGIIDYRDAVRLVTERGEAMLEASQNSDGTMAAVLGLDDELVIAACHRAGNDCWVANFNAPGQVVIAGATDIVARAIDIAKELGAKRVMALKVGGAFHTPLMAPARERLAKAIDQTEFRDPDDTVVANVDALPHRRGDEWPELLNAQLCSPVRWRQSLRNLTDAGFKIFVELGPGKVLTGTAKRSAKGAELTSVATPEQIARMLELVAGHASSEATPLEGEHLFATERLVVSPGAGVFVPAEGCQAGNTVSVGSVLGRVGDAEVVTSFAGELMGILAFEGERVTPSQPIAWLRVK